MYIIVANLFLFPLSFSFLPNIEMETNNQSNLTFILDALCEKKKCKTFIFSNHQPSIHRKTTCDLKPKKILHLIKFNRHDDIYTIFFLIIFIFMSENNFFIFRTLNFLKVLSRIFSSFFLLLIFAIQTNLKK